MRRLFQVTISSLLILFGLTVLPVAAGAVTASRVDPTGDVASGYDGTYDITSLDVGLTSTTVSATVHMASPMPSLSDTSWADGSATTTPAAGTGRELVVYLGKEFGLSSIAVVRNGAVAFGPRLNALSSCTVASSVSGNAVTISAPAACFNNPGRVDMFAGTIDLSHVANGPVDLAIANAGVDSAAAANDLAVSASLDTKGYYQVGADGGTFALGGAYSVTGHSALGTLNSPIVGVSVQPVQSTGRGYRLVAGDGGIFCYGDNGAVGYYGSMGGKPLNKSIVGMATTNSGHGYWEVASDGGIFAFGDAGYYGSMGGKSLNRPIVGMAATPTGHGYWLVASDGGIFAFGDAGFYGSSGSIKLNSPIIGISATPTGNGYLLAAKDGGVFAYGDSQFHGSGVSLFSNDVSGITSDGTLGGYYLTSSDGHVENYGSANAYGDIENVLGFADQTLNKPIVGFAFTS